METYIEILTRSMSLPESNDKIISKLFVKSKNIRNDLPVGPFIHRHHLLQPPNIKPINDCKTPTYWYNLYIP